MYIKSIELNNVRSYKHVEIEFSENINLLIGANNSGKSTIIKAIYKLQNRDAISFDDIRKGEKKSSIYINLDDINKKQKGLFQGLKSSNLNAFFYFLIRAKIFRKAIIQKVQ